MMENHPDGRQRRRVALQHLAEVLREGRNDIFWLGSGNTSTLHQSHQANFLEGEFLMSRCVGQKEMHAKRNF